ncbi:MAG: chorismate synthase [Candidatus Izimaplasma sp.]|nr:chorismate synthase [Candidatus Izimaplasma bacterium]
MSTIGQSIPISLFGESHGKMIGITIHNLPAGIHLDSSRIKKALQQRRPTSNISTARSEPDPYQIVSGYFNEKTTGTPLTIIIPNQDTRSKDYNKEILRPSHSDFTAHLKYRSFHDYRGGGHFSGRITAPIVILGSICIQILEQKDIYLGSHIASIKDQSDDSFTPSNITKENLKTLLYSDFPLINKNMKAPFEKEILTAKEQQDSVGGTIETAIINVPKGLGGPYFNTIEGTLAKFIYSIPAIKGLSFGKGFDITSLYGSEANDPFITEDNSIKTSKNNSGGLQGGITNGMPIVFTTAIKPTSSIGKPQHTVNFKTKEEVTYQLEGRHDPAIVHRVIHVINAITAYAILEIITKEEGYSWMI